LPINQNQGLFALLGKRFGGDGVVNFGLPDFRGRAPIHVGSGRVLGERSGEQAHTVSIAELPTHAHVVSAQPNTGTQFAAANAFLAQASNVYRTADNLTSLMPATVTNTGGSQAHLNMQPFLTLSFAIALQGIFPSPN
jgi:microcystin-dependent protein